MMENKRKPGFWDTYASVFSLTFAVVISSPVAILQLMPAGWRFSMAAYLLNPLMDSAVYPFLSFAIGFMVLPIIINILLLEAAAIMSKYKKVKLGFGLGALVLVLLTISTIAGYISISRLPVELTIGEITLEHWGLSLHNFLRQVVRVLNFGSPFLANHVGFLIRSAYLRKKAKANINLNTTNDLTKVPASVDSEVAHVQQVENPAELVTTKR
jgi:hypothetical protein